MHLFHVTVAWPLLRHSRLGRRRLAEMAVDRRNRHSLCYLAYRDCAASLEEFLSQ